MSGKRRFTSSRPIGARVLALPRHRKKKGTRKKAGRKRNACVVIAALSSARRVRLPQEDIRDSYGYAGKECARIAWEMTDIDFL